MRILPLIFFIPLFAEPQDPFAPQGDPEGQVQGLKEKPYQLEIAYGETEEDLPTDGQSLMRLVNADFLENATRLTVATSSQDIGEIEKRGNFALEYKVSELDDGTFDLDIHITTSDETGTREVNSEVQLELSKWFVMGGLTREDSADQKMIFAIAIQLTPRTTPSE